MAFGPVRRFLVSVSGRAVCGRNDGCHSHRGARNLQFRGSTIASRSTAIWWLRLVGRRGTRAGKAVPPAHLQGSHPGCVGIESADYRQPPERRELRGLTEQIRTAQSAAGSYSENGRGGGI